MQIGKSPHFIGSLIAIGLAVLLVYRGILFPEVEEQRYPWGSDTLGHVLKAEYLAQQVKEGVIYPDLLPDWYMGLQMLRYHPPLPYYLLVVLAAIVSDFVKAANWFIAFCALAGGLSWLLFRRWIGWLPALAGGVLFTFLPDNLRVAMAEGNLPRALATSLMPLAVYFLLRCLEENSSLRHRLGLAFCFALVVLSHAMMAAIYALCAVILALFCWLGRRTTLRRATLAVLHVALGILLSGWWLLPSLTGGITELNTSAMTEALAVTPLIDYLNPALRVGNPEVIYVGSALLVISVLALWFRKGRTGYSVALTLTGCFGVLITTPGINRVFNALPMHNLLWPLRFLGIASFMLLLGLFWALRTWNRTSPVLLIGVMALLAVDGAGSLHLIHLRPQLPDLSAISQQLQATPGWREVTLDLSRLGSAPSYFFSAQGKREQLFGWAYQGAYTARTVASLNEAVEFGYTAYLSDRLNLYGTDDVVILNQMPLAARLSGNLAAIGFDKTYSGPTVTLYHREGGPRAFVANWKALGIGRGAQNLAYLFPQIVLGSSSMLDDYTPEQLSEYKTVVLSGFDWQDQGKAEALVQEVAARGVRVVVDLTGAPVDPLARIPGFLGVWGEQVILSREPITIQGNQRNHLLQPFADGPDYWFTHMLQGVENEVWSFDYLGERAILAGYNSSGAGQIWFVGLNLPYHAVLTGDPVAVDLLSTLLDLPPDEPGAYTAIPLVDYRANQDGYQFVYQLRAAEILFVPLAHLEGMRVLVDSAPAKVRSFERLVAFEAPAGEHVVALHVEPTRIYQVGKIFSGLAILGLLGLSVYVKSRKEGNHD